MGNAESGEKCRSALLRVRKMVKKQKSELEPARGKKTRPHAFLLLEARRLCPESWKYQSVFFFSTLLYLRNLEEMAEE